METAIQRHYAKHKDDPEWKAKHNSHRRAYYERNKEKERAAALERYYKRKEQATQQAQHTETEQAN